MTLRKILVIGWLAILAVLSWQRTAVWKSNASLWGSAVRVAPCSIRAHYNLSKALEGSDPDLALNELRVAALLSSRMVPACGGTR
jgi:hypothetical protein